jgi:hypothetical protein
MMKRFATLLALLALSAAPAFATVLLSEGFTYPNGNLTPNGGWAVFSGAPPTDIQISTGRAVVDHNNAPDDHILFPVQSTSSKTYACFDVIVPPVAGPPKAVYFAMLKDGGTSIFVSRVYVVALSSGGMTFAISHSSTSATVGLTPWTAPIVAGQKYNVVINYDPVNKSSTMWVNPVNELSASVTDVNAAIAAVAVQGFGLRQSSTAATLPAVPSYAGSTNVQISVDNLGVGTTFADACAQYIATPTQRSTWGMVKQIYR